MKSLMISFSSGFLFALGLVVSGMTNPSKVKNFLNLAGSWDMSLAIVMLAAVGFNAIAFRFLLKRKPLFASGHELPTKTHVDSRLIGGAALFGIGWAIGGVCPGPGLVNAVTLTPQAIFFVVAMFIGMVLFKLSSAYLKNKL